MMHRYSLLLHFFFLLVVCQETWLLFNQKEKKHIQLQSTLGQSTLNQPRQKMKSSSQQILVLVAENSHREKNACYTINSCLALKSTVFLPFAEFMRNDRTIKFLEILILSFWCFSSKGSPLEERMIRKKVWYIWAGNAREGRGSKG